MNVMTMSLRSLVRSMAILGEVRSPYLVKMNWTANRVRMMVPVGSRW